MLFNERTWLMVKLFINWTKYIVQMEVRVALTMQLQTAITTAVREFNSDQFKARRKKMEEKVCLNLALNAFCLASDVVLRNWQLYVIAWKTLHSLNAFSDPRHIWT